MLCIVFAPPSASENDTKKEMVYCAAMGYYCKRSDGANDAGVSEQRRVLYPPYVIFAPSGAQKRHTNKEKYHAAAGQNCAMHTSYEEKKSTITIHSEEYWKESAV
jgi:hypothetical protein